MKTLRNLAKELDLTDEGMAEALDLPPVIMEIGLERYEFNEPMETYFRKKLQKFNNLE